MELFFLCTIGMALVSFVSMALSQPTAITTNQPEINGDAPESESPEVPSEASIIEFKKDLAELELIGLATA